jgi:hypothetical protein
MQGEDDTLARELIALERAALDRWGRGDPSGYLEVSAPDVTYFDPFRPERVEDWEALTAYYAPLRGRIRIERDALVAPRVQRLANDAAVLSFGFESEGSEGAMRWHCSEVYARRGGAWRIVHTHWSLLAKA